MQYVGSTTCSSSNAYDSLLSIAMHNAESMGHEQTIFASIEHDIISKVAGNDITILEHSAWFNNTQLTIRGEAVWESNPIDVNNIDV